jgi:hypothetical protein
MVHAARQRHFPRTLPRAARALVGAALATAGASLARAGDVGAPILSELRLGIYAHDPVSPEAGGADLNGEILFAPFRRGAEAPFGALTPRVHVGLTAASGRRTSLAYAGLSWTFDVTPRLFVEAAFGGAVHDGRAGAVVNPGRNAMGCRAAFRESASAGYRLSPRWSVMASVEHVSNAGLCRENRGLTNVGLRAAYTF